jgi:hypothetical protein
MQGAARAGARSARAGGGRRAPVGQARPAARFCSIALLSTWRPPLARAPGRSRARSYQYRAGLRTRVICLTLPGFFLRLMRQRPRSACQLSARRADRPHCGRRASRQAPVAEVLRHTWCHSPRIGRITAPGSSWPQSTRSVQRKGGRCARDQRPRLVGCRRGRCTICSKVQNCTLRKISASSHGSDVSAPRWRRALSAMRPRPAYDATPRHIP